MLVGRDGEVKLRCEKLAAASEITALIDTALRSRECPELRWGYDTEVVGSLIAVIVPVLWHVLAQGGQHRGAEVPESAVALVVGDMPVHQPP